MGQNAGILKMYVAIDFETTGVQVQTARIVEFTVAFVDKDFNINKELTERVNPGISIPLEATAIHGITNEMVKDCPPISHYLKYLRESVLAANAVIAYNGTYDLDVLHYELFRNDFPGIPIGQQLIDPYRIFVKDFPHTLKGACKFYLGKEPDNLHGSRQDVLMTLEVLKKQRQGRESENLVSVPTKNWAERGRNFYFDETGRLRFANGKYRDEIVSQSDNHISYLRWMLKASHYGVETKTFLTTLSKHIGAKKW